MAWLSGKIGKSYRLMTEAEWEYAARAGGGGRYTWGDDIGRNRANCDGCGSQWDNKQTAPVGSVQANAFGLHDMHGNVWEWVRTAGTRLQRGTDRRLGLTTACSDGSRRVVRGGSWCISPQYLRSADRGGYLAVGRGFNLGFRLARTFD